MPPATRAMTTIATDFGPGASGNRAATGIAAADRSGVFTRQAKKPRFWEQQQIVGGITRVGGKPASIRYPATGLHSDHGTLLACYAPGATAREFSKAARGPGTHGKLAA